MPNLFILVVRVLFGLIDNVVAWAIEELYVLLIQIANTNVFGDFVYQVAGRIYVFLGIFMVFKLSLSMVTYIINPDAMSDKSKGFSKLIMNVVISLILIVTVPTLFKEAFELQSTILNSNAIYQIVTGKSIKVPEGSDTTSEMINNARTIGEGIVWDIYNPFIYKDTGNDNLSSSTDLAAPDGCTPKDADCMLKISTLTKTGSGKDGFANHYTILIGTICGGVVAYCFLVFCFDAAIRAIKLGVLQIIAPIPILSMIDPKGGTEKLKKWASNCGKEFAGLFIRLAGVFFAVEIIQMVTGTTQVEGAMTFYDGGKAPILVRLFIIIGALMFAKQLPQFIENILGIKLSGGDGFNLKKRLTGLPGAGVAKTLGAGALGFAGGMAANSYALGNKMWHGRKAAGGPGAFKSLADGQKGWRGVSRVAGNVFSGAAGGVSAGVRGLASKDKNVFKAGGAGIKGAVDARNLRDKRQSSEDKLRDKLSEEDKKIKFSEKTSGVAGFVNRRVGDINRTAGTKTTVDYLEDELKALQYGDTGMQGYQYALNEARNKAAEFADFQIAKDSNGLALDTDWMDRQRNWINDYIATTGDTSIDVDRELTRAIQIATGYNEEDATAYRTRLSAKATADHAVLEAQKKVDKQQELIDKQQKRIEDQKKIDAVNKKQ